MSVRSLRRGSVAASRVTGAAIPTWVASSSGGANGADFVATTRPVGTAVGDHLFLLFHVQPANVTPPTFSGWTKLSGFDEQDAKFAIYSRIADLTALDTPTINPDVNWYGGWAMTAIRGSTTVSVISHVKNTTASGSMTGPVITTTVPNCLILSFGMASNPKTVAAPTGGPVDRYRASANYYAVGVATEDKAVAGAGSAAVWALSVGGMTNIVYGLALVA